MVDAQDETADPVLLLKGSRAIELSALLAVRFMDSPKPSDSMSSMLVSR